MQNVFFIVALYKGMEGYIISWVFALLGVVWSSQWPVFISIGHSQVLGCQFSAAINMSGSNTNATHTCLLFFNTVSHELQSSEFRMRPRQMFVHPQNEGTTGPEKMEQPNLAR